VGDTELRHALGDGARSLFEQAFDAPVAAGRIVREVERLGG
jgi:hypothetical protein